MKEEKERRKRGGGSLSKISSEETLSKLRLKLNQNKAKSTKHAGRPADWNRSLLKVYTFHNVCDNITVHTFFGKGSLQNLANVIDNIPRIEGAGRGLKTQFLCWVSKLYSVNPLCG